MSYSIVELEITEPLPTLSAKNNETGVALVVRRKNAPIGFFMYSISPNHVISPDNLAERLSQEIGTKLLQESIRDELIVSTHEAQFPLLTVAICTKDRPENLCALSAICPQTTHGRRISALRDFSRR